MLSVMLAQIPTKVFTADQVLSPYIYVFYVAFIVSFLFTPVMRIVALYYGIIDEPDNVRKMHSVPIAYLGGVAVFLGWMAGLAVSQLLVLHRIEPGWPTPHPVVKFSIVIGALMIVMLGLWDDTIRVRPWVKIVGQLAAAIFLLMDGIGIDCTRPLLGPIGVKLSGISWLSRMFYGDLAPPPEQFTPEWLIILTSGAFVMLLVVGCCNASNLMDGLDGLCGGVTAIIAAGFLFVAVHLAMVGGGVNTNWDALRVVLGLALLGAVLGFVPYNFNPASIFMGDTGSMLLGFACASMIILMAQERTKWGLAAMVMFALPVLDTALAFARRYINRRPVFSADRQHFHHQLVARGFSVKQTVLISYGLALFFALLGVAMVFTRTRYTIALYLVIFGCISVAAYKMGMVHERPRVVRRRELGGSDAGEQTSTIEPGTVLEVDEGTFVIDSKKGAAAPSVSSNLSARPAPHDQVLEIGEPNLADA